LAALEARIAALESGNITVSVPVKEKKQPPKETKEEKTDNSNILADDDIPLPEPPSIDGETDYVEPIAEEPDSAVADGALSRWEDILVVLKKSCPLLGGVLNGSKAYIEGERLLIDTNNEQFRSLINSQTSTYRDAIKKAAFEVLGKTYKLGPYRKAVNTDSADPLDSFRARLKNLEK
ncbi:MAG: hypothetical protein MJ080_02655, partial [Clostridia bacterium]|nr:hypothetical protein [Clostridia bacterium]